MAKESKYYADIYEDWTPCIYWIKNNKIMIEFEKIDDDQKRIENLELEQLNPEVTNHKDFLKAISIWTGQAMSLKRWKNYEKKKMQNVLLLSLHVSVNDDQKVFELNFYCKYPGQLGLWCSHLLKKINTCKMMKGEPEIVCVRHIYYIQLIVTNFIDRFIHYIQTELTITKGEKTETYHNHEVISLLHKVDKYWVKPKKNSKMEPLCLLCQIWTDYYDKNRNTRKQKKNYIEDEDSNEDSYGDYDEDSDEPENDEDSDYYEAPENKNKNTTKKRGRPRGRGRARGRGCVRGRGRGRGHSRGQEFVVEVDDPPSQFISLLSDDSDDGHKQVKARKSPRKIFKKKASKYSRTRPVALTKQDDSPQSSIHVEFGAMDHQSRTYRANRNRNRNVKKKSSQHLNYYSETEEHSIYDGMYICIYFLYL